MADELNLVLSINFSKGNAEISRSISKDVTITGDAYNSAVQSIGTSEEEVAQGAEVGTPGFVFVHNMDATNYIEIGSTTGVYDIKLKAGEWAIYRHNSATIYAKANTGACLLEYIIFED
jgi:hypothetical protein